MDVEEFTRKWGIKRSELSMLIDVSQGTLAHWFSKEQDRSTPPHIQKSLLYLDSIFTLWFQSGKSFPDAWAVFMSLNDRGTGEMFNPPPADQQQ